MSVTGEWSGLMESKLNNVTDGSKQVRLSELLLLLFTHSKHFQKPEVFVDVNSIPIFKKNVRPIAEQSDSESRKIWMEVTAGLRYTQNLIIFFINKFSNYVFFIFRLNDIDRATNAKSQVEQKQREEAKQRKDINGEWDTKVFVTILTR